MAQSREEPGPLRERDALTEKLQQEDLERARRNETEAARNAREARQRLENLERQRRIAPEPSLPGELPPSQSGVHDRATENMQDEALRRQREEYDRAQRELDAARSAAGRAEERSGSGSGLLGRNPVGADRP